VRIGVISDTHGFLDPEVLRRFDGVDHILHGGDIGTAAIVLELEKIAPVTAVLGNTDVGLTFRETEVVQLGTRKALIHHIVDPAALSDSIRPRLEREAPDVVVFGHSHKPYRQLIGRTLFLNPGYAGKQRFNLPRSIAILVCDDSGLRPEFIDLR
jgi:putative phosphoesterase